MGVEVLIFSEFCVVWLVVEGCFNCEIVYELYVMFKIIEGYFGCVYVKFGIEGWV